MTKQCGHCIEASIWVSQKLQNSGVKMGTSRGQSAGGVRSQRRNMKSLRGSQLPLVTFLSLERRCHHVPAFFAYWGRRGGREENSRKWKKKVLRSRGREIGGKEKALNGLLLWRWESEINPPREAPSLLATSSSNFMTCAPEEQRKQAEGNEGIFQGMRYNDLV